MNTTQDQATDQIATDHKHSMAARAGGPRWNAQVQGMSALDSAVGALGALAILLLWAMLRAQGRNRKLLNKIADLRIELERRG